MVRVHGPMLSQDARGSVGTAVNFSKNRNANYARKIPVSRDLRTASQVSSRAMLAFLSQAWHTFSPPIQQTWEVVSPPPGYTPYNAFISANLSAWNIAHAPSQANAPPGPEPRLDSPFLIVTAATKQLRLQINDGLQPPDWGWAIHRALTTPVSAHPETLVALILRTPPTSYYTDAPLPSGVTYYYITRGFTADGYWGPWSSEHSGTPL